MRQLSFVVLVALALLSLCLSPARADTVAYGGTVDLAESIGSVTVRHHHDWSKSKHGIDLFDGAQNEFSWIEVEVPSENGSTRLASPPLKVVWATEDGAFVVGLSDIQLNNPHHVVVWDREAAKPVATVKIGWPDGTIVPGLGQSVTNWVDWFDQQNPAIDLTLDDGKPVKIAVNGNEGRLVLDLETGALLEPADFEVKRSK